MTRCEIIGVLFFVLHFPAMVYGCSCFEFGIPACQDYNLSADVYTARVINASCNCIPGAETSSFDVNTTDVSCLSAMLSSASQSTSQIVTRSSCDNHDIFYGIQSCSDVLNDFIPIDECPYEGQVVVDCASLCPTTCDNVGLTSRCPRVCVRGCGCPDGMVIDEEQRRCVMPSQCPNKACSLVGQVTTLCVSSCPADCFNPGNDSCVLLCDACSCAPPEIADYITGRCVQQEQCTACPIEGQVYTSCGSSCPRTCDNVDDVISCTADCWEGCECPSGTVIDVEKRRCVQPDQCRGVPSVIQRTSGGDGRCEPQLVCPHNDNINNDVLPCEYTVEIVEVFKGTVQVGNVIKSFGPDLLSSCGNPGNILSVGETYVVGVGGPCSQYNEWTPYNRYSSMDQELLANNCESSSAITPLPSVVTLLLLAAVSAYFCKLSLC